MLYDIILRKEFKEGKRIFLYKRMTREEVQAIAGSMEDFRNKYIIIESR